MRFTSQEDQELIRLVSTYGRQEWKKISSEIYNKTHIKRTPRQCKERYNNYLSPDINNSDWTLEEDKILLTNCLSIHNQWSSLKSLLPERSEISIKNRFKQLNKYGINAIRSKISSIPESVNYTLNISNQNPNLEINHLYYSSQLLKENNLNTDSCVKSLIANLINSADGSSPIFLNIYSSRTNQSNTQIETNENQKGQNTNSQIIP